MIEWVALLTMLIDHVGYTFFPDEEIWRIIGRVAFPLYAFLMAFGIERTKNKKRYLQRLFLIACISQIPFSLLFDSFRLNAVFTLLFAALTIYGYEKYKKGKEYIIMAGIFLAALISPYMDYGLYGILLCLTYYLLKNLPLMILIVHSSLNILHSILLNDSMFDLQFYSLAGSVFILFSKYFPRVQIFRGFYRSFYPLHLIIILILQNLK